MFATGIANGELQPVGELLKFNDAVAAGESAEPFLVDNVGDE